MAATAIVDIENLRTSPRASKDREHRPLSGIEVDDALALSERVEL